MEISPLGTYTSPDLHRITTPAQIYTGSPHIQYTEAQESSIIQQSSFISGGYYSLFPGPTAFMTNETYLRVAASLYMCPNCLKQSVPNIRISQTHTHTQQNIHTQSLYAHHTHSILFKKCMHIHTPSMSPRTLTNTRTPHTDTHRHTWNYEWVIALPSRAWGFPHKEKQVTSAQLPTNRSTATYCCSVCSKTCKYRPGTKSLLYYSMRLREETESSERELATN